GIKQALCSLVDALDGMYAAVIMLRDFPDMLVVIRKRSPLCIGYGKDEMFIASDSLAFADKASSVVFVPDESFAFVYKDRLEIYNFFGELLEADVQPLAKVSIVTDKAGYEHFMLKEIEEQYVVVSKTVESLSCLGQDVWNQ